MRGVGSKAHIYQRVCMTNAYIMKALYRDHVLTRFRLRKWQIPAKEANFARNKISDPEPVPYVGVLLKK